MDGVAWGCFPFPWLMVWERLKLSWRGKLLRPLYILYLFFFEIIVFKKTTSWNETQWFGWVDLSGLDVELDTTIPYQDDDASGIPAYPCFGRISYQLFCSSLRSYSLVSLRSDRKRLPYPKQAGTTILTSRKQWLKRNSPLSPPANSVEVSADLRDTNSFLKYCYIYWLGAYIHGDYELHDCIWLMLSHNI